jgi:hypothetical protein
MEVRSFHFLGSLAIPASMTMVRPQLDRLPNGYLQRCTSICNVARRYSMARPSYPFGQVEMCRQIRASPALGGRMLAAATSHAMHATPPGVRRLIKYCIARSVKAGANLAPSAGNAVCIHKLKRFNRPRGREQR